MELKRGEIWFVSLDSTIGSEINKSRPAVIIQNDFGNKNSSTTIIAPITSKLDKVYPFEVLLTNNNCFGLENNSKVLLDQIRVVDKKRLIKKLGAVNQEGMIKINEAIKISLSLD